MAVNLSLFDGVPSNIEVAKRQFQSLILSESKRAISQGKYLVLKMNEDGKYKNFPSTWIYESKPKTKYLQIYKLPKIKLNQY